MEVVNVSVKVQKRPFVEWASDPNNVYIGRWSWATREKSKWANPYSVKKYGREDCIKKYEEKIRNTPELWNALEELEGKVLGCWCKPDGCHGDVLMKLLREKKQSI